ncbi:uncharacterized protein CMC5_016210 [Chondromyces crocatus]|uniref:Protein kinase domain-containing protein n=2 Tax=Chondromyces crocatus TaxID=52 RepID=A0A0K1E9D2_CHOCO|nr:uncharacterized protein CMC5_016210 [Chondromyces crocatus]
MGTVYEARHRGTGRRVAVKVLSGSVSRNEAALARFEREAKAAGSIQSQYITEVLDTGADPVTGQPFIVMEYLDGEDLSQVLARTQLLSPDAALRIAAQTALGLSRAHEARVIHRDIKPGNLFLLRGESGELTVKVCDFGVAKIVIDRLQDVDNSGLTRTGSVLGSPLYMSPEQARGNKDIDPRSDLWSLGIVLYQMLSGRRPHDDITALGELIIAICSEPPPPIQDVAPWVSPQLAAVVHGALQFDPAQRFQSAAEMFEAMRALLPERWALDAAMLAPPTEAVRQVVAPRLDPAMAVPALGRAMPVPSPEARAVPRISDLEADGPSSDFAPTLVGTPISSVMHPEGLRLPAAPFPPGPPGPPGFQPPAPIPTGSQRSSAGLFVLILLLVGVGSALVVYFLSRG